MERVSKELKGAYNVRLCEGESTRRQTHTIKQVANWCLFVASKMPNAQSSMEIYLNRGPKTRAKVKARARGLKAGDAAKANLPVGHEQAHGKKGILVQVLGVLG